MKVAIGIGILALAVLAACSSASNAPSASSDSAAAAATAIATAVAGPATVGASFNATAAAGGAISATGISADDLNAVLAAVPQAKQLQIVANSSPPGAKGADVASVSLVATDTAGVLKSMDVSGKKALADGLLTAAGAAWPKASISLLISDPGGGSSTVIGTRPQGGPNTIIAS